MRLILENSTVCHSRRISLLCPVDHGCLWTDVVDGFFGKTMILAIVSFVLLSGISFSALAFWLVWCCFSTESLILAQDERWRRA